MTVAPGRLGAGRRGRARATLAVMAALLLAAGLLILCLGDFGLTPVDVRRSGRGFPGPRRSAALG